MTDVFLPYYRKPKPQHLYCNHGLCGENCQNCPDTLEEVNFLHFGNRIWCQLAQRETQVSTLDISAYTPGDVYWVHCFKFNQGCFVCSKPWKSGRQVKHNGKNVCNFLTNLKSFPPSLDFFSFLKAVYIFGILLETTFFTFKCIRKTKIIKKNWR